MPAFVLSVKRPVQLTLLVEQQLPPRATAPSRQGIALVMIAGGDGERRTALAHTLPSRPHRRAALYLPQVGVGDYLLLPHRQAPAGAAALPFMIEVEARWDEPHLSGGGAAAAAAATLKALPGGLPHGGLDVIDELGEEVTRS